MSPEKKTLAVPLLLIAIGIGWLLTALGVTPDINWLWTVGLAAVGILVFVVSGCDKTTVVIGPLFILAGCLSVLRQTGRLAIDTEIPLLVIATGVLLLVARRPSIPLPTWLQEASKGTGPR